ncbi:MAG: LysR family transcriptional regulator [Burkholderiaceae bacterium]|nr:LysR family transcriptional regulator [Burkholderiaceae bacterium]
MSDLDVPPSVLRAFVQVARLRSFSRAARVLKSRQSTVSTQIKRLEDQVGQSLFARSTRKVELTPLADRLLPIAEEILELQAIAAARLLDAPLTGAVRLAASEPLFAVYEIDRMLSRFAHTHPGIELDLQVADEAALPALVIDSNTEADLALCTVAISGFEARSLRRERLMWVGARGVETDAALRGSIVAVPPFAPASASALEGKRVLRSSSLDAAIRLVRAGLGAMLLPESELARFDMVVLDRTNLPIQRGLDLYLNVRLQPDPAIAALRNQLMHWMSSRRRSALAQAER